MAVAGPRSPTGWRLAVAQQESFVRPRLKIRARPASLRMNEHDEAEGGIVATTQEAVQISAIVPTLTVDDLQEEHHVL